MPGLDPGIHVLSPTQARKNVDGRVKPGHDEQYAGAMRYAAANHAGHALPYALPCN
jgi:hypothetical protein